MGATGPACNELWSQFTYSTAIGYEPGVSRRDPSPVLRVDGLYYVWYSRSTVDPSGYCATVWYATSPDGREWAERGQALATGGDEAWDGNGVFTPTILTTDGKYYLFYTAVPKPFTNDNGGPGGTPTAIGVALAATPDGPWRRFAGNPVLRPGAGDEFDSHRVDDGCMIVRDGRFWLYYKGRQTGRSPSETKMGLAVAPSPTGPYTKHPENPVLDSGHEVCVWPHREGVAALVAPTGPQGGTVQFSCDGIHFAKRATVVPPRAPGPFRTDAYRDTAFGTGITWGLCQNTSNGWSFLERFDCDLTAPRAGGKQQE